MRSVVALLEARPETILDDYGRLFALAGLRGSATEAPRLAAAAGRGTWQAGSVTPPWQLAAALAEAATGGVVLPVGADGGVAPAVPAPWDEVLRAAGARTELDATNVRRLRPSVPTPALDAVLPDEPRVPAAVVAGAVLLLAVPAVGRGWPVAGAVALMTRLILPRAARVRRRPLHEILAETLAVLRESVTLRGAVLDGTVWQVQEGALARWPVGRNVILAGADPVAVDTVAMRLAGVDPRRVPWLRLCSERELGEARPDRIRVVGQPQLLDLDFALPPHTLVPAGRLPARRPWAELAYNLFRRAAVERRHGATPWGRLCREFQLAQKAPS